MKQPNSKATEWDIADECNFIKNMHLYASKEWERKHGKNARAKMIENYITALQARDNLGAINKARALTCAHEVLATLEVV